IPALIIGGQHIPSHAVGGQKCGRVGRRDRPLGREPTGGGVDPEARDRWHRAMPDIEHVPIRAERQHGRPPYNRHLGLRRELAGLGIHGEGPDLILVLQAHVERVWHLAPSCSQGIARCHGVPPCLWELAPSRSLVITQVVLRSTGFFPSQVAHYRPPLTRTQTYFPSSPW